MTTNVQAVACNNRYGKRTSISQKLGWKARWLESLQESRIFME